MLPVRPPFLCLPLLSRISPSPARFTYSGIRYTRFKRVKERAHCPCGLPFFVYPCLAVYRPVPRGSRILVSGITASREQGSGHAARTASLSTSLLDRMLASPARIANLGIQAEPLQASTVRGRACCPYSLHLSASYRRLPRGIIVSNH
jgi:hypothetical protein